MTEIHSDTISIRVILDYLYLINKFYAIIPFKKKNKYIRIQQINHRINKHFNSHRYLSQQALRSKYLNLFVNRHYLN